MKTKLLTLLVALTGFCSAAELVLSTDTKSGGVTTTVTVGRIQADPAADGTITLSVIPREVIKVGDSVISDRFSGEWLTITLAPDLVAQINAAIVAARDAAAAAKATPAPASP